MGLPKSIIKKYGISKKAWDIYRGEKTSSNSSKKRGTKIKKMARKRKSKKMYRAKTSGSQLKPMQILVGGGAYGAIRSYIDGAIKPFTSKIPLGTIADEAVLFAGAYLLNKNVKNKTIKSIAIAGMAVEASRIGEALRDGSAFNMSSNSSNVGAGLSFPTLG